jgi:hypothetical protein
VRKYVNPNVKSIDSVGKSKVKIFDRVDINDIDSVMVKGDSNDTKYVTQSINYDDNGDGSVTINKVMDRYNTRDTFYFSDGTDGIGWHSDMITRVWPRIRDTKAAAIILPGKKARVGFKQGGDSYRHQSFTRDRHGDGTSTVIQKGENPKTIYSVGTSGDRIDTLYDLRFGKREPTATNNPFSATAGEVQIRTARMETSDTNKALDFARGSTLDGRLEYREGRIRYLGDNRYEAFKVVYKPVGS